MIDCLASFLVIALLLQRKQLALKGGAAVAVTGVVQVRTSLSRQLCRHEAHES